MPTQGQEDHPPLPTGTRGHRTEHEGCDHQGRIRCHPQAVQEARMFHLFLPPQRRGVWRQFLQDLGSLKLRTHFSDQPADTCQADDELDKPYLAGFEWDPKESYTRFVVHQSNVATSSMSGGGSSGKKKKKNKDTIDEEAS